MRYGRFWGVALAVGAIGLAGCGDDNPMAQPDLTAEVNNDMAMTPDAGEDMTAAEPATAQITVAAVVGTVYSPVGMGDAGAPLPLTHSLAVVVDFPAAANTAQHSSGTALNGCTWNR